MRRLSTPTTRWPCASRQSTLWLPMKPAAPVTRRSMGCLLALLPARWQGRVRDGLSASVGVRDRDCETPFRGYHYTFVIPACRRHQIAIASQRRGNGPQLPRREDTFAFVRRVLPGTRAMASTPNDATSRPAARARDCGGLEQATPSEVRGAFGPVPTGPRLAGFPAAM